MNDRDKRKLAYREHLITSAPLLLSHLNRDPYSSHYGSFDRGFWAWQSKDFSNTDFQRAMFPLTVLYLFDFDGNTFYDNPRILKWISASLDYWCKIQNRNGSFNQWYPYEYSVGNTAFTLGPVCETYTMLGDRLSEFGGLQERLLKACRKAADFICSQPETHGFISNHRAGMAAALAKAGKVVDEPGFLKKAGEILVDIRENQSEEGWFNEYGGADPGYESLGISYLAGYFKQTGDLSVLEMIVQSIGFYAHFVHPDGTVGGEYGSRNTELFFPAGFETVCDHIEAAESILNHMHSSFERNSGAVPEPSSVDYFNMIPLLDNYAQAFLACEEATRNDLENEQSTPKAESEYILPCKAPLSGSGDDEDLTWNQFPHSQMCTVNSNEAYSIIGLSKGGVIKIFDKTSKQLIYDNCGIHAIYNGKRPVTSQMLDFNRSIETGKNQADIEGSLYKVRTTAMSPFKFLVFRFVTMTLGRMLFFNKLIKGFLASILIKTPSKAPVTYKRSIKFEKGRITIHDSLKCKKGTLKNIESGAKFVSIFMGSARYFQKNELTKIDSDSGKDAEYIEGSSVNITDVISWDETGMTTVSRTVDTDS